ncbi:coiled-coil domain-containing protein [Ancylobacter terrae]|uniref:hypothetical protein n=1 Tax=Ancylobacter sp. sgz301288 TaxID=3342077 RepID=UPI003858B396
MIEAIMFFLIGFLVASLLALLVLPAVWRRAVRLTTKRIEGAIPVSMAEIQADKDQFRADFAMQARRLELNIDTLTEQTARQAGELAVRAEAIGRLESESRARAERVAALETSEAAALDELRATAADLGQRTQALEETRARLAEREAALRETHAHLDEQTSLAQSRQIDIVALTTQRDMLRDRGTELDRDLNATRARLEETRTQLADTVARHAAAHERAESLAASLATTESALAETRTRAETLARDLVTCETELGRLDVLMAANAATLAANESEISRLLGETLELRQTSETDTRRFSDTLEMFRAEKAMLEDALVQLRGERGRLHAAIVADGAEAIAAGGAVDDDAFLRERISDVAAEVARLTAALEGPASPINGLLAGNDATAPSGDWREGAPSLADRIRALQSRGAAALHGNAAE